MHDWYVCVTSITCCINSYRRLEHKEKKSVRLAMISVLIAIVNYSTLEDYRGIKFVWKLPFQSKPVQFVFLLRVVLE